MQPANLSFIESCKMFFVNFSQPPVVSHSSSGGYAPGLSAMNDNQGTKRVQAQGHPLKSFTVPAPPPISAPSTPQPKHIGTLAMKLFR